MKQDSPLNQQVEKGVYHIESYTIQYATLLILRWCISPAQNRATYYRRSYAQGNL